MILCEYLNLILLIYQCIKIQIKKVLDNSSFDIYWKIQERKIIRLCDYFMFDF